MNSQGQMTDHGKSHVAMITGGSRGVGLAVAKAYARRGWAIALAGGTDEIALASAVDDVSALGQPVSGTLVDVRRPKRLAQWVAATERELGPVEVAIACAGNLEMATALAVSEEAWDRTFDTHVKGTFFFLQAVARVLEATKRSGSLITVTSFGGIKAAGAGLIDYSSAKGAIVAMTRSLAKELLPYGIRVNSVLPCAETRMTDTLREFWHVDRDAWHERFAQGVPSLESVAETFVYLGSPESRHVTGQIMAVDGGFGL